MRLIVVGQALRLVFTRKCYVLLGAASGLSAFILATWLPNFGLVWNIATSESVPIVDKVKILGSLIGSIATNFTIFSALSAIVIAVLFGMNVATMVYYVRLRRQLMNHVGQGMLVTNLAGLASGLVGIGCVACGTLVLSPALTFVGASLLIGLLPFGGEEFSVLGIAMLGLSLVLSAKKIGQPITCQVRAHPEPHH